MFLGQLKVLKDSARRQQMVVSLLDEIDEMVFNLNLILLADNGLRLILNDEIQNRIK